MAASRAATIFDVFVLLVPSLGLWLAFSDLNGWPQNDDPYYGKPVQWLVEEGHLQVALQKGVLAASVVTHILAGALSSLIMGFSYRSLFLACIFQQWLGAAAVYGTGRVAGLGRKGGLLLGFAFAIQPMIFCSSFTFMTDTPAAAWVAVACLASCLTFRKRSASWLLVCSCAVAWGFWIRQTNLFVLGVPLLTLSILSLNQKLPFSLVTAILFLLIPAGVSWGLFESEMFVQSTSDRISTVTSDTEGLIRIKQLAISAYAACLNVGLFGLPLAFVLLEGALGARRKLTLYEKLLCDAAAAMAMLLIALPFVVTGGNACMTNSTGFLIQNGHAGPVFLADMDEPGRWGQLDGVEWPLFVWQIATIVVIAVDGLFVWWLTWLTIVCRNNWRQHRQTAANIVDSPHALYRSDLCAVAVGLFATSIASVAILWMIIDPLLDRYLLVVLAPMLCGIGYLLKLNDWQPARTTLLATLVLFMGLFLFYTVYVHDLLSWNNRRWEQVKAWTDSGKQASEFDGGRDVNAWLRLAEDPNSFDRPGDTSAWWSGFATHCISVGTRPGWEVESKLGWRSWATGDEHHLYIMRAVQDGEDKSTY